MDLPGGNLPAALFLLSAELGRSAADPDEDSGGGDSPLIPGPHCVRSVDSLEGRHPAPGPCGRLLFGLRRAENLGPPQPICVPCGACSAASPGGRRDGTGPPDSAACRHYSSGGGPAVGAVHRGTAHHLPRVRGDREEVRMAASRAAETAFLCLEQPLPASLRESLLTADDGVDDGLPVPLQASPLAQAGEAASNMDTGAA